MGERLDCGQKARLWAKGSTVGEAVQRICFFGKTQGLTASQNDSSRFVHEFF